ncbi:hypothetical protein RDI58_001220 [Solanum bulbocastanum]|uniref:Uncharacterized protein n=1 Tax=Solanum bulbocastanum TaxID=147425 RepID=A0AAN8UDY4_SOLBU
MNFDEDKLETYNTPEECVDLLAKGSSNGGIASVFDEIPYVKLFLANYCLKFTTIGPTYKNDGFGFAFPIVSPLVPDVLRAVLNVTEGENFGFLTKFIHEPWHIIRRSNLSLRERSRILARKFDSKDYSCHTFKKSALRDVLTDSKHDLDCSRSPHGNLSMLPSPRTTGPPSQAILVIQSGCYIFQGRKGIHLRVARMKQLILK